MNRNRGLPYARYIQIKLHFGYQQVLHNRNFRIGGADNIFPWEWIPTGVQVILISVHLAFPFPPIPILIFVFYSNSRGISMGFPFPLGIPFACTSLMARLGF